MRKSTLSQEEVAELDAFNKGETRKSGFNLMSDRDKGYAKLTNGSEVQWHVDRPLRNYEARLFVRPGNIIIDGKKFNVDELMKYTRWA